jgi:hypothetical protein
MSESARGLVLKIWQEKNQHVLSEQRREKFLGSDLVGDLSELPLEKVRKGAAKAMNLNSEGHLLLTEWLREAERVQGKTVRKPQIDRKPKTDRKPKIDRAPRSRPQESRPGTHRWQEAWDAWNKPGAQH